MSGVAPNIAVVILAAGASTRMGTPKQLLNWGENSLLESTILTALKLKQKEVITVLGANYHFIKKEIQQYPIIVLKNTEWKNGLGKSIACATKYIIKYKPEIDGVLIILADQPFVSATFLETLIENFKGHEDSIVATSYGKKNGVPVLFDKVYFTALSKLSDDFGAKYLLKENESCVKALIPPVKNVDLDTKEDYEKFHKLNFDT